MKQTSITKAIRLRRKQLGKTAVETKISANIGATLLSLLTGGMKKSRRFVNDSLLGQRHFRQLKDHAVQNGDNVYVPQGVAQQTARRTMLTGAGLGAGGTAAGFLADDVGNYVSDKAKAVGEWLGGLGGGLSPDQQSQLDKSVINSNNQSSIS